MRLELAPPGTYLSLELQRCPIGVALGAGTVDSEVGVEDRSRDGDRVVGAGECHTVSHLGMLQVGHVTGHALRAIGIGLMERVLRDLEQFAMMSRS